jgi:arylsulfatase A
MGLVAAGMPLSIRAEATGEPKGAPGKGSRPNIVFVLGDDMGIDYGIGCYGSDRKGLTPNLDKLAAEGMRFERCFANAICGPTRCQLMTGRYPFRTGGWDNGKGSESVLPRNEYPMARILSEAGYDTCCVGKWRQMVETPREWGFGEYVMSPTPGSYYWTKQYKKNGQDIQVDKEVFYPDVCQDYAVEFIRKHGTGGTAAGKPFFLYYPTHLMHDKLMPTPDMKRGGKVLEENLIYLDKQIGALAAELDRLNLRDNTLIIFAGDNGSGGWRAGINGRTISGLKHTMLEGGALVPCILNWKGGAPGGRVVRDLVDFSDFLPTFSEHAGAKLPQAMTYDGRSFVPLLRGEKGNPREWIFLGCDKKWYVREDQWKLNDAGELFDMQDAPFTEPLVPADADNENAKAARKRLHAVLDKLIPADLAAWKKRATAPSKGKGDVKEKGPAKEQ